MREKPNITIPEQFALNGEKTDFTNELINNGFDKINPEIFAGDNLNKFIDDTYKGLNGVLGLYEGIVLHEMTTIYNNTSVIGKFINEEFKLYKSLQDNNIGHPVTDTEYWEELKPDFSEVMESLSNKVDINSNVIDGQWVSANNIEIFSTTATGTYTIDLSTVLPNDNYTYEVLLAGVTNDTATGTYCQVNLTDSVSTMVVGRIGTYSRNSCIQSLVIINNTRQLSVEILNNALDDWLEPLSVRAYRRIGTNL